VSAVLKRPDGLLYRDLGTEVLVMVPGEDDVHLLTGSSALLWDLLEGGTTAQHAARRISEAYGELVDSMTADVERGLQELMERGLALEVPADV
jgi:hypothetical protein